MICAHVPRNERIVANLLRRVNGVKYICNKKFMSIFATRLRELRGPESQASFAASIGLNRVQYAKYESGQNSPSVEILERICLKMPGVSADWLLGLDRGKSAAQVKTGDNSAVAIGANARATVRGKSIAGELPQCSRCCFKKRLEKIEKAMKGR